MKTIGLLIFLFSLTAGAAVQPKAKNALRQSAILRGPGAIHGGLAGKGFSLLGIKSHVAKNQKLERLTVGVGNINFMPQIGSPGYFHIENSKDAKRVVVNFAQTPNAQFDEKTVQKVFSKSPFVRSTEMTFDPQTQTTSLILNLKKPASIRAVPVAGVGKRTAQLNIDLFEDSLLKKGKKK